MKNISKLALTLVIFFALPSFGKSIVKDMTVQTMPDKTRVIFKLTRNTEHFLHYENSRFVLRLANTKSRFKFPNNINSIQIESIKAQQKNKDLFIAISVFDKFPVKSFMVKPSKLDKSYRLFIDFYFNQKTQAPIIVNKDIVIVLDPGHGGEDTGAIGSLGTREKTLTLAVARDLQHLINQEANMKAHLTRVSDNYVSLRKRAKYSNNVKADLFISIHADGYKDPKVSGTSVYVLAKKKASSAMSAWLEDFELESDFLNPQVEQLNTNDTVRDLLTDLSNKASKQHSIGLARTIIRNLKNHPEIKLHSKHELKANFYVLKFTQVPAVLFEIGFISNEQEERRLATTSYKTKVAQMLFSAIKDYIQSLD